VLKRSQSSELFQHSLRIGVVTAVIASFLVAIVGHFQAQHLVQSQPMKMAAAEALWKSEDPASLSIFAIVNEQQRQDVFSINVPDLLSIMAYNKVDAQVQGINNLQADYQNKNKYGPGDYIPPVTVTYWSFRIMVGAGTVMILLSLVALFFLLRKELEQKRWLLWLFLPVIGLPYLANTSGWIMAEMGRQPWIVFGLLKTAQAVSPNVNIASVLISLIAFTLIYGGLAVADVYLLVKYGKRDPMTEHTNEGEETASVVEAY
jgi:cytochrome d ubiquinol oxidase subunit I